MKKLRFGVISQCAYYHLACKTELEVDLRLVFPRHSPLTHCAVLSICSSNNHSVLWKAVLSFPNTSIFMSLITRRDNILHPCLPLVQRKIHSRGRICLLEELENLWYLFLSSYLHLRVVPMSYFASPIAPNNNQITLKYLVMCIKSFNWWDFKSLNEERRFGDNESLNNGLGYRSIRKWF